MIRNTLKILFISCFLQAQETEVIKKTAVYPTPRVDKKSAAGQLFPGAKVIKLKKDRSGKFIKATLEFYIPIESLEEGRVALAVGEDQLADNAKFQLISADKDGKRIKLKLKVSNVHQSKDLDFSAMALLKLNSSGGKKGELNPFEGKHQDLAIIKPNKSVTAELIYDFKSKPKGVELMCTGKMGGDRIYFSLGF
ncbi:MAG: hypothetical protein QF430_03645 [Candidatus Marinimicrobia bacterium]|nr:hypothetical protein [Candidatus Neomarinimicrobiota bacterium]